MTITASATLGATSNTGVANIALSTSTTASVGDLIVVIVAKDNVQITDGNTSEVTGISDTGKNDYTKAREFCNGQGSLAAGATVSVWYSKCTVALATSDSITAAMTTSVGACAISAYKFTMDATKKITVAGTPVDQADDAADPSSMTISGLTSNPYLFLRGIAIEGTSSAMTPTAGFTAVSTAATSSTSTGMSVYGEFKIATATSATSDPTIAAKDCASVLIAFQESSYGAKELAKVGSLGGASSASSASSLAMTTTHATTTGHLVVVTVGKDNSSTVDGQTSEVTSITDSAGGNTWTKAGEYCNSQSSAGAGATVSVWYSILTNAIANGGTITANFSSSIASKGLSAYEFIIGSNSGNTVSAANLTTNATHNATPASMAISGLTSAEYLFFRGVAVEGTGGSGGTTITITSGFTALTDEVTGGASTDMGAHGEFIIATATGETSNPTWTKTPTTDSASVFFTINVVGNYTQSCVATSTSAKARTNTIGKSKAATSTHTAARLITPSLSKRASSTVSAARNRVVQLAKAATSTNTATMARVARLSRSVASISAPVLSKISLIARYLAPDDLPVVVATLGKARSIFGLLSAAAVGVAIRVRQIIKSKAATSTVTARKSRAISFRKLATEVSIISLSKARTLLQALAATSVEAATKLSTVSKSAVATATSSVGSIKRRVISYIRIATDTTIARNVNSVSKDLTATSLSAAVKSASINFVRLAQASSSAVMDRVKSIAKSLSASTSVVAAMANRVFVVAAAQAHGAASKAKSVGRITLATLISIATKEYSIAKSFSATASNSAALAKRKGYSRLLSVASVITASAKKQVAKAFVVVSTEIASATKSIRKVAEASAGHSAAAVRSVLRNIIAAPTVIAARSYSVTRNMKLTSVALSVIGRYIFKSFFATAFGIANKSASVGKRFAISSVLTLARASKSVGKVSKATASGATTRMNSVRKIALSQAANVASFSRNYGKVVKATASNAVISIRSLARNMLAPIIGVGMRVNTISKYFSTLAPSASSAFKGYFMNVGVALVGSLATRGNNVIGKVLSKTSNVIVRLLNFAHSFGHPTKARTITAKKRIRKIKVRGISMIYTFTSKRPAERETFAVDITHLLGAGEIIQSVTAAVSIKSGIDASVSSMPSGFPSFNGTVASQLITGGVDGNYYYLTFTIITSSQTIEVVGQFLVTTGA